jgi:hypothetical protein
MATLPSPFPKPPNATLRDSSHAYVEACKIALKKPNQFSHKVELACGISPY